LKHGISSTNLVFEKTPSVVDQIKKNQNLVYNQFIIKIKDSGEGISEQGLKSLFIDFSRLKEHDTMNQRGTGLGLSICKQIIQKMGGSVSVKS
jgi:two-component system sensor histidine kinase EvgS